MCLILQAFKFKRGFWRPIGVIVVSHGLETHELVMARPIGSSVFFFFNNKNWQRAAPRAIG